MRRFIKALYQALLLALMSPAALWACTVCFGNPESRTTQAAKTGILFLLGVITLVLGGIAWTAASWARRAKKLGSLSDSAS